MIDSFDRLKLADAAPRGSEPPESVLTQQALLTDIDERAGYMPIDTQVPDAPQQDKKATRRGWLTAAVAFGVVLLFGAITVFMMSQQTIDTPTDLPTTTQVLSVDEQAKVDAAHTAVVAFNDGDTGAFVNSFREASAFSGRQVSSTYVRDLLGFRMAIGEEITIEKCALTDDSEAQCDVTSVDGLGLAQNRRNEFTWVVGSDNGRLVGLWESDNEGWWNDVWAFGFWVRDAHPDVWLGALAGDSGCEPPGNNGGSYYGAANCLGGRTGPNWMATPEAAEALLGLIDEYKAHLGN